MENAALPEKSYKIIVTSRFRNVSFSKCSPSTVKRLAGVFKFFHSEDLIRKVPFSARNLSGFMRISVHGRPNRKNEVAFSNLSGIVWTGAYEQNMKLKYKILLIIIINN